MGKFLNFENAENDKHEPWDNLQRELGSSDVSFDDTPIVRQAAGSEEQAMRAITDSLWAGSGTVNEESELRRHLKGFIDEGQSYIEMEKELIAYGYPKAKIRRVFQHVTGVDPVQAYLDLATYSIPPAAVPRYNYGWGFSKKESADYYFILPFVNKFAIYRQTGLNKEIVFDHLSLMAAQEELKKYVKEVTQVTPDGYDHRSDIIQRVSSMQFLRFSNEEANKLVTLSYNMKRAGERALALKAIADAKSWGRITPSEHEALVRYVQADDASETSPEEKERQKQFEQYQQEEEGRTVEDEVQDVKIPQEEFNEALDQSYNVNMQELSNEAFALLTEIAESLSGFKIQPMSETVDLLGVTAFSPDDDSHVDKGSVRFIIEVTNLDTQEKGMGIVIMLIENGRLKYKGTFKGQNKRDYALTAPGIASYFDDLQATPVEDVAYSPMSAPTQEANGPYR